MHRYIALIWNPDNLDSVLAVKAFEARLACSPTTWKTAYVAEGHLVVHAGMRTRVSDVYRLARRSGVVLGTLFLRHAKDHGGPVNTAFDIDETERLVETRGRHLVEHYWGRYVAIIVDDNRRVSHVLRDPMAEMTCFHCTSAGIEIFFSNIEDCVHLLRRTFSIDWGYVRAHLVAGRVMNGHTGLSEVEDVAGGELVTLSRVGISRTVIWSPSRFASNPSGLSVEAAAYALRSAVQCAVDAWASCYSRIVHSLSGGLDSSIIAACLANTPSRPEVHCLNFYIDVDPLRDSALIPGVSAENLAKVRRVLGHADERPFARLVAHKWGFPLVERARTADCDLTPVWRAPLAVIPSAFVDAIDTDLAEIEAVRSTNADAFFSGMLGDTVFYATFQAFGAIDYAYLHGLDRSFLDELFRACTLSKESMWSVLKKAIKFGSCRAFMPPVIDRLRRPNLLRDGIADAVSTSYVEHPWVSNSAPLPPGKQNQVRGLAASLPYHFRFHRYREAVSVNPLAAQPVVETCLQIPVCTLLAGGISRGLARIAFADLLPPEIRNRTTKGAGGAFYQRLARNNMAFIRESLLEGVLVREGLLDAKKIRSYLVDGQIFSTVTPEQVTRYLAAEAWLRQWAEAAGTELAP